MPDRTVNCAHCGAEFVTSHPRKIYCARPCASAAMNAKHNKLVIQQPKDCEVCGDQYMPMRSDSKHCSVKCNSKARNYRYEPKDNTRACDYCGVVYRPKRSDSINCPRCSSYLSTTRRRARFLGAYVEDVTIRQLVDRDGAQCQLCEQTIDMTLCWPNPMSVSVDHVVPLSKGGQHSRANTQLAHLVCNQSKGAKHYGKLA